MTPFVATLSELAAATGGVLRAFGRESEVVRDVATDTRRLPPTPFAYVALRGPNFDGHEFVSEAVRAGAGLVVVSALEAVPEHAPTLLVDDTLAALQALAGWWRGRFTGRLVAITGSNGKTVVKEMLATMLARHFRVYRSPGSFNSQVGVALALLGLPLDAELALIECGVSRPGEMARLRAMVRPDLGVLTTVGVAHLAGFGTPDRIAREKLSLFAGMPGALVLHESAAPYRALLPPEPRALWVGRSTGRDVRVLAVRPQAGGYDLTLELPGVAAALDVGIASHAEHDADNAACAAALGVAIGLSAAAIGEGLAAWEPVPLRIEVHTSPAGITLINDSYSADPASMRSALQTLGRLSTGRRAVAVLGGMRDLGAASAERHREVGRQAAALGVGLLVAVGEHAQPIVEAALVAGLPADRVARVADATACAALLDERLEPGDVVLVKASRPLRLERTAEQILESVSPTRLYLDLGAVAENVRRVRSWVGADVALFAVVKSFGYGSDVVRVSELLEQQGADYLYVAYPDEGALLRRRGLRLPILVGNVLPDEADKVAKYRLSAVVYTEETARALAAAARRHDRIVPVHVKLDSGMGRFGLEREALLPLARLVADEERLDFEGVMSHLAVADEAAQDDYTRDQIARFDAVVGELEAAGLAPRYRHLANSAGLLRFRESHHNAVRLGLGLYGCLDVASGPPGSPALVPALALHSRLVGIRELAAGRSIGYGRTFHTVRPTRMGLVALGYNDGLPWAASNRGELFVRGRRAPIVGSVCMDVTMVDLSAIPEARVGDDVVVFGSGEQGEPTVPELAAWSGTIPYEILVRLSPRVRRIVRLAS